MSALAPESEGEVINHHGAAQQKFNVGTDAAVAVFQGETLSGPVGRSFKTASGEVLGEKKIIAGGEDVLM